MKKVYWRPQKTPVFAFVLIAMLSVAGIFSVERFRVERRMPYYREKVEASRLALLAMETVRNERIRRGFSIDVRNDPAGSGLIGTASSPVTSDPGNLQSKQTSINPNFAAVIVEILKKAKVRKGDPVAVSFSGSFPALNISVIAALKVLDCTPTIITSASASQWGANNPAFLWLDMERLLYNEGLSPFKTAIASMGGRNDRGEEMTDEGRSLILETLKRNEVPLLSSRDIRSDIDERMAIYFRKAPPKAYINVGGGLVSAGVRAFKLSVKPGLLSKDAMADTSSDSVIRRFLQENIPVVHMGNVRQLAKEYGLPVAPAAVPRIGVGDLYFHKTYSPWLAGGFLVAIILALYVFSRSDWGFRLLQTTAHREETGPPEPMV
jgi:poly-gamma-glutamate system protein